MYLIHDACILVSRGQAAFFHFSFGPPLQRITEKSSLAKRDYMHSYVSPTYLMSAFVIFTVMLIFCTLYKFGHLERAGWVIGHRWKAFHEIFDHRAVATMTQSHYKFPNVNLNNYMQARTLCVVAIS